jgi:SecD/SecF fusion protein
MKIRILFASTFLASLVFAFSSCTPKPDLSKGLKVTLNLDLKDAILQMSYNPKDSVLISVLDQVDANQNVTKLIFAFLDEYEKEYPGHNPAERFYASASDNSATPITKDDLKNYLVKSVSNKLFKMRDVTSARVAAFFGVKAENVRIDFTGKEMTVYVPGVTDENLLKPVFANRDGIRFWAVANMETMLPYIQRINDTISLELKAQHKKPIRKDTTSEISLTDLVEQNKSEEENSSPLYTALMPAVDASGKPSEVPWIGMAMKKDTATVNKYIQSKKALIILPSDIKLVWGEGYIKVGSEKPLLLYALRLSSTGQPLLSGQDVLNAKAEEEHGEVKISINMTPPGGVKWARVTGENKGKPIAMEMDNYVFSAPNVLDRITGGKSSVAGSFTVKEANDLAKAISSGAFPLQFTIEKTEPYQNKK